MPQPDTLSERLYRWLLLLYPAEFRAEYGEELVQVFLDNLHEERQADGRRGVLRLWWETMTDLSSTAFAEHLAIFWQDLRYGARMLLKSAGFSLVAIFVLALGIGATGAMFSVLNGVLLRPLPFARAEQLVAVWQTNRRENDEQMRTSVANFVDWRERNRVFSHLSLLRGYPRNYVSERAPERLRAGLVSPALMELARIRPIIGRPFSQEEEIEGKNQVVVLSESYWRRRFDASPAVLGKPMKLDGRNHTIVGVMPDRFEFAVLLNRTTDIWIPAAINPPDREENRGGFAHTVLGRLKPGVSVAQAQSEMDAIAAQLARQHPDENTGFGIRVVSYYEQLVGEIRPALLVLLGAVICVLLICCANVANLLLVRAAVRQREIAIRTALGASRSRLFRQLLTENILLTVLGGALGLGFAWGAVQLLVALNPGSLPRVGEIRLDGAVLAFTAAIVLVTGAVFSVAPALQISQIDLADNLKDGGRGSTAGVARNRVRSGLVVSEVALALVLLSCAGLLAKSYLLLQGVDPGFNPKNLISAPVMLPEADYAKPQAQAAFFERLVGRLRALPGVSGASAVSTLPMSGSSMVIGFTVREQPPKPAGQGDAAGYNSVDPAYFRTMGIPLIRGRAFTDADNEKAPKVALISQATARRFFKNADPIGKHLRLDSSSGAGDREIVGIVGDVHHDDLASESRADIYAPYQQAPLPFMTVVARTAGNPAALGDALRRAVAEVDPAQPVGTIRTAEQYLSDSTAQPRFNTVLLGAFAAAALVLAAVGLYGVMAYSVTQRTHEIGVRLALGARPRDILQMVVGQGMGLALLGVGLGLAVTFALARLLSGLLFGVEAIDPLTFGAVAALLASVALLASYVPARRATRVDPMIALRYE
ncbi:ABC transporter permease [Gloeobacter morelensis]|uniref:ABC transporter permease n=1 Tax=Gloeobacter morelensis MG652769 TaxID=2781736 RepID=A0ABY3PPP8_9CYAN|nr:ABC transporter permease [Gloeobacter morelensis]UFP95675.1 ABC transporter permease [Gloeobacter morelensis MG652769]